MASRQQIRIALLGTVTLVSACGGGGDSIAPPLPTKIQFDVTTTGVDIDPDGFTVAIGAQSYALPANGTLSLGVSAGDYTLAFTGEAFNCDLVSPPTSATVVKGQTTHLDIKASCTPYLRNAIVYTSEEFSDAVMAIRPDGSRRVQLTNDGQLYASPVVSPDGQSIAVSKAGVWDAIYVLNRFGKNATKLVSHGNFNVEPAWSPDGTKLAFHGSVTTQYGDQGRIFVANRDGTGLRQVTPDVSPGNSSPDDTSPSWSPDGTRILFARNGDISIINVDGTGLVSTGAVGATPWWSRDGTHIAYQSAEANPAIWVMDMTFTSHRLTTPVVSDQIPRWSPDGSKLVFDRVEAGVSHLYTINADGSGVTRITSSPKSDTWPDWTPNF